MPTTLSHRSRRAFPLLVSLAAVLAVVGGIQAAPPQDVPTYALDSAAVYRCEVALALFLGLYLPVAAIALAIEGRTMGKVSTTGFELPSDLSSSVVHQQALIERQERMQQDLIERDARLSRQVDRLSDELKRLGSSLSRNKG